MLNADLTGVSTAFPLIAPCTVTGVIAECSAETSKNGKPILQMKLTASHPVTTTLGEQKTNFPFRHMISLTPTYKEDGTTLKYDPRQNLKLLKEAVWGDGNGAFGDPATYIGKTVSFAIVIESSVEFGDQNRIRRFLKTNA
jgi:hypothetical protein